ncbi:hypothetical protein Q5H94_09835 [Sphingomonas sp. CA1-15]|uniref:YozE SAM-like domain-containing protein n=1 Tax=Sphingomonas immobilis TaxID=3063997 RepID=A0ABT8ZZB4_9SPHN|nr:hypothetical protein [Sphingomonas sp. CA1-15]
MKKVTKPESEKAIRHLVRQWANASGVLPGQSKMPSFDDFVLWLRQRGGSKYLEFRSVMGALEDAELWFDEELRQTWRN